jgi:hypothetical protein
MPDASRRALRLEWYVLPLCLLAQSCLLLARLDLLPAWGDEHFTLVAASRSVTGLLRIMEAEKNNPPLHPLLVHFWLQIPWPAAAIVAARALSVLFALATTVAVDRFWLRQLSRRGRLWFLLLWTMSPCLLLYARMTRSYSLQLLLFSLVLAAAMNLLRDARRAVHRVVLFAGAAVCLLYVHYLPGLAILATVALVLTWRAVRERRPKLAVAALASVLLAGVLYSPWLPQLRVALDRMARAEARPGASLPLATEVIRLGYWFFAFSFGETPPLWVLAGAILVAPGIAYLLWKGVRHPPEWLVLVLPVAIAGYCGAGRWVSFAFVPARLLFVLPFFLLLLVRGAEKTRRAGWIVCGAMVVLSAGSIASYFHKTDFLNKGYLLPYGEIARIINQGSAGEPAAVIADVCNTDPWPLASQLLEEIPFIVVSRESTLSGLRQQAAKTGASVIWCFRNTHDISPGGLNRRLESELAESRQVRTHLFVPYSQRDRWLMKLLGWAERPTHYVQLLEMQRQ